MHALNSGGAYAAGTDGTGPRRSGTRSGQARTVPADGSKTVLGPDEISRAMTRVAHEILERTNGAADVILMGIPTRGVPLARRLASKLNHL